MHTFSQFFEYTEREIPIEDFDEYFMLAKEKNEFWDMLAGAIYNYNYNACQYVLKNHDYYTYLGNTEFCDLIEQSLYQIEMIDHDDAEKIRGMVSGIVGKDVVEKWRTSWFE